MCGMSTTSTPPRELTRKGQETRQRIVDAAADLMFHQGVAQTTIEDIRASANVSSSQLYHYFDDKPALVIAVVDHQADTMIGGQQTFDFSTLEGLRAWRDFLVTYQDEHGCIGGCQIGSLGGQLAETDPDARAHLAQGFKRWEATIQSGLRKMHARGELTPDTDPDTLALALLAALQGGLLLTQVQRDTKPLEAALDAMLDLVARLNSAT
jgi:TetR/AcrR family transcriptional regulator, transcriptional repressor for nem operon